MEPELSGRLAAYRLTAHFEDVWYNRHVDDRFPTPTYPIIRKTLEEGEVEQSDRYDDRWVVSWEHEDLTWTVVVSDKEPTKELVTIYSDASTPSSFSFLKDE